MAFDPEHLNDTDQHATPQQDAGAGDHPLGGPHIHPNDRTDEEHFYETEADDGELEFSGVQLSGTKETLEDPP